MALFDFLKSHEEKLNERKEEIAALQQQLTSLRNEVGSKEKEKEELRSQIVEIKNQVVAQKKELYDLQQDKEKTKKQVKNLKETYDRLNKVLKSSTIQIRCIPSSSITPIVNLSDKYLISIDAEDFQELSKYYSLKAENESYCEKKNQREKYLQNIEDKIKDHNNELSRLREELIKQREINHDNEEKIIKEKIAKYSNELNEIKNNINRFLKEHKDKMRFEMMHEIYQRFTACEDDVLKKMRENIDEVSLVELQYSFDRWEDRRIVKNGSLVKEEWILYNLRELCKEFIHLNIAKLTKEMKSSDWESVKLKIGSTIQIVESLLVTHGYTIHNSYFDSLYNVMEAKYISIQKQELEREKEREEREAQREYERAIKKAIKDEEKAQEALEQKKREIAEAQTQEKIQKLQEQIQGLEKALVAARELRERAMSMAQQTKIGYVYVISNIGSFGKDVYKIGMTRRLDPMERVLELSNASVPFPFDVHTFIYSEDAPALEADLHRRFDAKKVNSINYRKEYFHVTLDEIKAALKEKGVDAQFVDEPDAFQYRESLVNKKIEVEAL